MKKLQTQQLLDQLQADTRQLITTATLLQQEDPGLLLTRPAPDKWSVIQIVEHLNSYSRYYLPALEKALKKNTSARDHYQPGWLGNYFTRIMLPGPDGEIRNKMASPTHHIPDHRLDAQPVLSAFIAQQHRLLVLLEQARSRDVGGIRVPISISRLIRLKLGDTFRFFIAHEQRHFVQVAHTLVMVREEEPMQVFQLQ